jgi:hypothetical protein
LNASEGKPELILQLLPKLLNSTVVTFMNGTTHTSERALHGYFFFHRLFLWALETYPNLQEQVNGTVKRFIDNPDNRLKRNTANVGEWLALLTVSTSHTWRDAASAYLNENFERNVMWYLRENSSLRETKSRVPNRLTETFNRTTVSRNLLAFQVLFLDIARPAGMSLQEIAARYDANNGIPTREMEDAMKAAVQQIKNIRNYEEWFRVIKVDYPGDGQLEEWLTKSVASALTKDGYHDKPGGGGGRGGHNNRGGYRGGRGGRY